MFSRNENRVEFDVFVEVIEFIEKGHDYENVEGDSNGEGDEWIDESGEDTGGRGSENESDDENISGEDSEDESVGEDSGDELSDYKSDDHCEPNNFSNLEFEDDPLHGSLNKDACTLSCETGQKVKLEKDGVTFQVKTYVLNHTCVRSDPTKESSAEWIASKIESVLRENPGMKTRGPFGGVLLAAIGLDGNTGLFPVAFVVVESECKEYWTFFFENLSMLVGDFSVDKPWTFMSDRQKESVCRDGIEEVFWQAAKSYSAAGFNFAPYKIKEFKPAAYEWLFKIPAEIWSRHAFDPRIKNDHVTNNISESFNHWGLNLVKEESRKCHLLVVGDYEFEVQDENINYIVNLRERTCNCRIWDISGIPCRHAALGISHRREDLDSYCDSRFFKENYMKAYKYSIHPVPDQTFWPHGVDVTPTLLPPIIKRMLGRSKKTEERNRVKNQMQLEDQTWLSVRSKTVEETQIHVPLSKLARKRKTPPLAGRKRKAAVISSSQPPAPAQVSSSQPLHRKDPVVPSMHAAGSSLQPQPPSYLRATYLPPSFWRGIGVSPHRETRSKKHNDAK
ncbi:hypothetical protein Sango_0028200 [Sesamum angolense]|uniref:SWIM-type domain-containing protein n=1 Tax=Sesamum angolense TaxID=2727404 RepID=A0AAE1XCS9_9LAMI|nr:hypothetical protein Sango_0028200 [Sesamum angolense]